MRVFIAVLSESSDSVDCVFEWKECDGQRECVGRSWLVHVNWVKGAGGGLARLDCRRCGEQCVSDEASAAS